MAKLHFVLALVVLASCRRAPPQVFAEPAPSATAPATAAPTFSNAPLDPCAMMHCPTEEEAAIYELLRDDTNACLVSKAIPCYTVTVGDKSRIVALEDHSEGLMRSGCVKKRAVGKTVPAAKGEYRVGTCLP